MVANSIRSAVLAVAGAAIVASTLMTGVASAAPTEKLATPPGSEVVAIDPSTIIIPATDIQVKLVSSAGSGAPGERAYARFEAKNIGSKAMMFDLVSSWSSRRIADDTYYPHQATQTVTLDPGQAKYVDMRCEVPNTQYECWLFVALARDFHGIDTNPNNNAADFQP